MIKIMIIKIIKIFMMIIINHQLSALACARLGATGQLGAAGIAAPSPLLLREGLHYGDGDDDYGKYDDDFGECDNHNGDLLMMMVLLALLLPLPFCLEEVTILVMIIMWHVMIILVMMILLALLNPLPFFLEKVGMMMIIHLLEYADDADGNYGKCP